MSEWKTVVLGDVVHLIGGGTPKKSEPDYWGGEIPWLSVKDFNNDGRFVNDSEQKITELGLEKSSTTILKDGQIIISARGTIGALAQVYEPMAFNQSCYGIDGKPEFLINDFLYYLTKHSINRLKLISHGAVFDTITKNTFQHINVNLPPLPEQKAIAHILGRLDDKIELNRQMNQTLEAMAQALFKSWFVDFDPVLDNALAAGNEIPEALNPKAQKRQAVPAAKKLLHTNPELAKQFPNSFTYNETLGKWIPEGWEVKTVGELSTIISKGTTPRKGDLEGLQESIPFIKVRDIDDNGNLDHDLDLIPEEIHLKQLKRSILKKDDLLFSIAGTIGRVAIVPSRLNNSNCNQAVAFIRLNDKSENNILVHQFLRSDYIQGEIHSKVVQAVQANTSLRNLSDLKITLAVNETLRAFNDSMNDFYNRIALNKQQTETLTILRDTLLPQLISGKVRVPEGVVEKVSNTKLR